MGTPKRAAAGVLLLLSWASTDALLVQALPSPAGKERRGRPPGWEGQALCRHTKEPGGEDHSSIVTRSGRERLKVDLEGGSSTPC